VTMARLELPAAQDKTPHLDLEDHLVQLAHLASLAKTDHLENPVNQPSRLHRCLESLDPLAMLDQKVPQAPLEHLVSQEAPVPKVPKDRPDRQVNPAATETMDLPAHLAHLATRERKASVRSTAPWTEASFSRMALAVNDNNDDPVGAASALLLFISFISYF